MEKRTKPTEPASLAETWEDRAIRQAFQLWEREIKPPGGVWEAISRQVRRIKTSPESRTATSKQS